MASGRPDWYSSIAMHGKHLTDYVCVAVDADGNMLGIMQGWDGAALQPIAVDGAGVMKANLVLQDLSFLTVRPAYGSSVGIESDDIIINDTLTNIFTITGQGIVYDFLLDTGARGDPVNFNMELLVDDVRLLYKSLFLLYGYRAVLGTPFRLVLIQYNRVDDNYTMVLNSPVTFESKFEIKIYQATGGNVPVHSEISYALTP